MVIKTDILRDDAAKLESYKTHLMNIQEDIYSSQIMLDSKIRKGQLVLSLNKKFLLKWNQYNPVFRH